MAKACNTMGMTVYGLKTSSESVDHVKRVYTSSELPELLQTCDYICNILPSTSHTKGLLSNGTLKVCSGKPIRFINIGRGDIIDERSIVEAVNSGWIEKAFLDVFENEPLPPQSPLWDLKDVTVTPHVSGAAGGGLVEEKFIENLENYVHNRPLKYIFNWDKQY